MALQRALLSAGSLQGRQFGKQLAPRSNLHCQCEPAQIASDTQSGQSLTRTPFARCCPSMALVLSNVYRSAMLAKLHEVPSLQGLLPFVRATYANPTSYVWEDEAGVQHRIIQAEGGEQGDPLMPLLFSLAIHDPLQQAEGVQIRRVWNRASVCPEEMAELGPEVWNPEGMKVLGTLVGSMQFVEEV